jgi:hypothetical protein
MKCIITRQGEWTEIDRFEVEQESDELFHDLVQQCSRLGYWFKYYTSSDVEGIDFEVVVS